MAVITFDLDNGKVSVLVEKTDIIREKDGGVTYSQSAKNHSVGTVLVNEEIELCMVRGERD